MNEKSLNNKEVTCKCFICGNNFNVPLMAYEEELPMEIVVAAKEKNHHR